MHVTAWLNSAFHSGCASFVADVSLCIGGHVDGIGIDLGISGKIEDSNILLSYLYLKRREDYGVGTYNLFDEAYYRELTSNPEHDYFRVRQRETGIYLLFRYPLSRFLRLDFDQFRKSLRATFLRMRGFLAPVWAHGTTIMRSSFSRASGSNRMS